jgi:hypothetical protein
MKIQFVATKRPSRADQWEDGYGFIYVPAEYAILVNGKIIGRLISSEICSLHSWTPDRWQAYFAGTENPVAKAHHFNDIKERVRRIITTGKLLLSEQQKSDIVDRLLDAEFLLKDVSTEDHLPNEVHDIIKDTLEALDRACDLVYKA